MVVPDDAIPLREYVDHELKALRRDIETLSNTIKDTAQAHEHAHDRDHHQTELATAKAEAALSFQLSQIEAKFEKVDSERKRQIEEAKNEVSNQARMWSNLQGKGAAFGILLSIAVLASFFVALWAALSPQ